MYEDDSLQVLPSAYLSTAFVGPQHLLKQCLDNMKVILGENHLSTLSAMSCLATTYDSQGKYRDAEVLYMQCLDKMKVAFGESHPRTIDTMNSLANAYIHQGKYIGPQHH